MRIGFSLGTGQPVRDHKAGFQIILERGRAVSQAGLDSLTVGDHHATPFPYYQNIPMIGRLMAEWDPTRPIGCLFLIPLWHPVLLAEQVATLATMSDVPFIVQAAIGDGAAQSAAMGKSLSTRGDDLDESLRILTALWAGETVSSERFGVSEGRIAPLPPHGIDLWIAGSAPRALRRAAEQGASWYADARATVETAGRLLREYTAYCHAAGTTPRAAVRKDVLVLRDAARANQIGDKLMERGYRGMERGAVAYGSVGQVVEQLGLLKEQGFDEANLRCMMVEQSDALETIKLCGEVKAELA